MPKEAAVTIDKNRMPSDYQVFQELDQRFETEKRKLQERRARLAQLKAQWEKGNANSLALSADVRVKSMPDASLAVRLKNVLQPVLEKRRLQASAMRKAIDQRESFRKGERLSVTLSREFNFIPLVQMLRGQEVTQYDALDRLKIKLSEFKCIESARRELLTKEVEHIFSELRSRRESVEGQIKKIEDFEARIGKLEKQFSDWMGKIKKREQAIAEAVRERKKDSRTLLEDWFKRNGGKKIFSRAFREHKKQQWQEKFADGLKKMRDDFYTAEQESKESAGQTRVNEVAQETLRYGERLREVYQELDGMRTFRGLYASIKRFSSYKIRIRQVMKELGNSPSWMEVLGEKEKELDAYLLDSARYSGALQARPLMKNFVFYAKELGVIKKAMDKIILQVRKIEIASKIISSNLTSLRPEDWHTLPDEHNLEILNQQLVLLNFFKNILSDVDFWHQQVSGIGGYKVQGRQVPDGVGEMLKKVMEKNECNFAQKLIELKGIAARRSDRKGFFSEKPIMRAQPTQAFYKVLKELDITNLDQTMQNLTAFENEHYRARTCRQLSSYAR